MLNLCSGSISGHSLKSSTSRDRGSRDSPLCNGTNYVPLLASTKIKPSRLQLPSPKMGYFDEVSGQHILF